jgi:hypothetical protein
MTTQFSMLGIMNAALSSQGLDEIVSTNDGTPEYRVLQRNWPSIVEAELEDGLYSFTKQQAFLQSRQPGKFGYEDSYLVPASALHVRNAWTLGDDGLTRINLDWSQDGTAIHVDEPDGVYVEYMESADPSLWGANFSRGVQMKLEAVVLRALKEEAGEAAQMEQMAEVYFQRARTNSTKSRSEADPYKPSRFERARFGLGPR